MTRLFRGRTTVTLALGTLLVAGLAGVRAYRSVLSADQVHAPSGNPFLGHGIYRDPRSAASVAASVAGGPDRARLDRIAEIPVAVWLTPEVFPSGGRVVEEVSRVMRAARSSGEVALFVVYGIEDRDCAGGQSAGGLAPAPYQAWIREIAAAAGRGAVVILEPDALAAAPECDRVRQREHLLSQAARALAATHTAVYIDAGHADWVGALTMARMLRESGIEYARGFAVNVAGYDRTRRERAYGRTVVRSGGGKHFVIDTGRNGAGPGDTWCNPAGRALGAQPRALDRDGALDAMLWIKPPGESDGVCNGGPSAGQWWTTEALALARNSGW